MAISRTPLHPPVVQTPFHQAVVAETMTAAAKSASHVFAQRLAPGPSIQIPLFTVSRAGNFDALMTVRFGKPPHAAMVSLILDTGNDTVILPSYDDIKTLPNFGSDYEILSEKIKEPFGCPAVLLRGPLVIPTPAGDFRIENCSFFACKGPDLPTNTRNFGAGWISQWESFTDDDNKTFTVLPPLRTGASPYRYVEFDYAPAPAVLTSADQPKVVPGSMMTLRNTPPSGYQMFEITRGPDAWWMAIKVQSLTIGDKKTDWPGAPYPMAMIDTGGGPVFLSDPDGYLYKMRWPEQVALPDWTSKSKSCQAIKDPLTIVLSDEKNAFSYRIDTTTFPAPVQDLTLVLCQECSYMQGNRGMNIGGISALFNFILIDNQLGMVGLKSKNLVVG
jgi:hypothetical protein